MSKYLGVEFVDPAEMIFFFEDGTFDAEATNIEVAARLEKVSRAVIPGFYGSDHSGKIRTFSRGGSDITGSIVARGIRADMYENWTDVSGFLVADPRIIPNPEPLSQLHIKSLENWLIWELRFSMRMPSFL